MAFTEIPIREINKPDKAPNLSWTQKDDLRVMRPGQGRFLLPWLYVYKAREGTFGTVFRRYTDPFGTTTWRRHSWREGT